MSKFMVLPILLVATFALAPAACASRGAAAAPQSAAGYQIPAVALSYDGTYLAWITTTQGRTDVTLASWTGKNARPVPIPGNCTATGLRWAPRWNELAVLTRCNDANVHSAIWLLDVNAGKPLRQVAGLKGYAHGMQWQNNGKAIAFLYAPDATHAPDALGAADSGSPTDASEHHASQVIAAVSAKGGALAIVTPPDLNVHEFRLSPIGDSIAFTATAAAGAAADALPALYVKAGPAPKVVFDPTAATGALHGLQISLPRSDGYLLLFLGRQPGASADDLYTVSVSGGTPINQTAQIKIKPTWFTLSDREIVATCIVDGQVQLARYGGDFNALRQNRLWFSIAGPIGDGRAPSSVSLVSRPGLFGLRRIAFVQSLPGQTPAIRSGLLSTQPPPVITPVYASAVAATQ